MTSWVSEEGRLRVVCCVVYVLQWMFSKAWHVSNSSKFKKCGDLV